MGKLRQARNSLLVFSMLFGVVTIMLTDCKTLPVHAQEPSTTEPSSDQSTKVPYQSDYTQNQNASNETVVPTTPQVSVTNTATLLPSISPSPVESPTLPALSNTEVPIIPTETSSPDNTVDSFNVPTDSTPIEIPPTITPFVWETTSLQTIESDNGNVQKSGLWGIQVNSAASGGSYMISSGSPDDTLSLSFVGPSVEIILVRQPISGSFAVDVDGQVVLTVEAAVNTSSFGTRVKVQGLAVGDHHLRLYPLSGVIAIDAFGVEALASTQEPTLIVAQPSPVGVTNTDSSTPEPETIIVSTESMATEIATYTFVEPSSEPTIEVTQEIDTTAEVSSESMETSPVEVTESLIAPHLSQIAGNLISPLPITHAMVTVVSAEIKQTTDVQPDGSFELSAPFGVYKLIMSAPGYLPVIFEFVLGDQALLLPTVTLIAGDVNGDAHIDMMDVDMILGQFGQHVNTDTVADLNRDGIIDIFDLAVVSARVRKTQ